MTIENKSLPWCDDELARLNGYGLTYRATRDGAKSKPEIKYIELPGGHRMGLSEFALLGGTLPKRIKVRLPWQ